MEMIDKLLTVLEQVVSALPPEVLDQFKQKVMAILEGGGGQAQAQAPEQAGNPNVQPVR